MPRLLVINLCKIGLAYSTGRVVFLGDQPEPGGGVPVPRPVPGEPGGAGGLPPGHLLPRGAEGHGRPRHAQAEQPVHQVSKSSCFIVIPFIFFFNVR